MSFTTKKVMSVKEEALPPLHNMIMVGTENILITQQDFRTTIDTRYLSYNKLLANGQRIPVSENDLQTNTNNPPAAPFIISHHINTTQNITMDLNPSQPSQNTTQTRKATVQELLDYDKLNKNLSAPFPVTYSVSTSTYPTDECSADEKTE